MLTLTLAALIPSLSCTNPNATPTPPTIRIGIESRPKALDPRHAWDAYGMRICKQLVYSTLVRDDYDLRPVAGLAERWETPSDTTWVFHLRPGVRFHDGQPLTAQDVVFTFEHLLDPETRSAYAATLGPVVARVEAVDELTVWFELVQPVASFLSLVEVPILPRHVVERGEDLEEHLVGSGPFRFVSQTPNAIVLEANPDYFEGPPRAARLEFKVVTDDNTRYLKARKGELDLLINTVPLERVDDFLEPPLSDSYQVMESPGIAYNYLAFNMSDSVVGRLEVRQAMAYALDVEAMITHRLHGHAVRARSLLAPVNWYSNQDVRVYEHDPERAVQLLEAAGLVDPDGDGPEPRLRLELKTSTNPEAVGTATVVQAQLAAVGIEVEIRSYEWGTFYGDVKEGRFQVTSMRWVGISEPDFFYDIFHSAQLPPVGRNRGRYSNPRVDELVELGRRSLDADERRRCYDEVQAIVAEELPYISLWHVNNIAMVHRRIGGYRQHPKGNFASFREMYVEEETTTGSEH